MCRIPKCLPDTSKLVECFGGRNRTEAQVVLPKNAILSVRYSIIEICRSRKHVNHFFVDLLARASPGAAPSILEGAGLESTPSATHHLPTDSLRQQIIAKQVRFFLTNYLLLWYNLDCNLIVIRIGSLGPTDPIRRFPLNTFLSAYRWAKTADFSHSSKSSKNSLPSTPLFSISPSHFFCIFRTLAKISLLFLNTSKKHSGVGPFQPLNHYLNSAFHPISENLILATYYLKPSARPFPALCPR
jgi:hypothetical protein